MPKKVIEWFWEEAFDKFGFGDGDGLVMTGEVMDSINRAGYTVWADSPGVHNYYIIEIADTDGTVIWSDSIEGVDLGYTNPREVLPKSLVEHLDKELPSDEKYKW